MTVFLSSGRARRVALPVAFCVGLAAVLTACGEDPDEGTNGVGKLSATEIERKAQTAANAAGAVRLSGTLVTQGETYKLNMRLKTNGGTGTVTSKNSTFQLLRIEDTLFLKADAGFWSHADGEDGKETAKPSSSDTEAADKLQDKYVKVPEEDPSYEQLSGFTDMKVLLAGILTLHGKLNKGARDRIGGVKTIKINGSEGDGGTLDVSLEGTPYPLQLVRAGGAGTLSLADWGRDFELAAPAKGETVDYGSRLPATSD
ncbi:hypothetical protein OIE62_27840 [Streptomyces scopuliridis]|uniref:Uncharacterized protein n=1 Tax=Streptomyces scopuliridis TaxID=452529 RepID=A0ACD4ZHA5_9ACTN|nr:hypothetical protein [Streptomyces scopuliridis]WSB33588.1 hypothetical protein OG949_12395 [Streptomyces scopuliridis]WSB97862.1 hypothetical protein OG835_13100 [Streptomyces scopuliridis]WSC08435.1 hypothetical protein OIE62_27840 [Streptomyces scopuliridis]